MLETHPTFKKTLIFLLIITILFFISSALSAQGKAALNKEVLYENNIQLPSKDVNAKMIRVTFPPGFKTPWHTHKGPGPRYIIKGQLKIVEGGQANTYSAGEVFWESGMRMSAENIGEGEAELVIFQLAPSR